MILSVYTMNVLRLTCINDLISVYKERILYILYKWSYQRIQWMYLKRAIYLPVPRLHKKVKLPVCSEDQVAAPIDLDLPPEEVSSTCWVESSSATSSTTSIASRWQQLQVNARSSRPLAMRRYWSWVIPFFGQHKHLQLNITYILFI